MESMVTTVSISEETKERLKNLGRAGDTYEDVIRRMCDITSKHILMTYLYDESDSVTLDELRAEVEKRWPKSS